VCGVGIVRVLGIGEVPISEVPSSLFKDQTGSGAGSALSVSEVIPLVVYEFNRFKFVCFGCSIVSRSSPGLGQPLSRTFYMGGEVVNEMLLDGSEVVCGVEGYCD
jgi:hypothetical protein